MASTYDPRDALKEQLGRVQAGKTQNPSPEERMSAPYPGESLEAYRARRKSEDAGAPSPEAGFEAQKAKVAAQVSRVSRTPAKNAINIDTAAEDEETVASTHKALAGGVKKPDPVATKAADKDKAWAKLSPEEQQAAARGSNPSGAAHSTSTPGAAPQSSMGEAMSKAGLSRTSDKQTPASVASAQSKNPTPSASTSGTLKPQNVDAGTTARNNMATPRGTADSSIVSGRTAGGSQAERDQARAASTRGSKGGGKAAEAKAAARSASPRSAASAAPTATPVMGRQFPQRETGLYSSRRHAEGFAAMITPEGGPSSKLSDKPSAQPPVRMADSAGHQAAKTAVDHPIPSAAANPSPVAPTPAGGRFPASPEAQAAAPMNHGSVGIAKPKVGEVTRAIDNPKAPASKMRAGYASHLAEGGNNDTYWAGRDSAKAKRTGAKTAKSAPEVVTETPSLAAAPTAKSTPAAPVTSKPAPSAAPASKPTLGGAPAPAAAPPMRFAPEPQRTPMSSQMANATPAAPAPAAPSAPATLGGSASAPTAAPTLGNRPSAPAAGPPAPAPSRPTATPNATPPAPTGGGRTGAAPRSPEVGGGRGGVRADDHSNAVGGHNYGSMTTNHNTYNINYGHVGGSQGNAERGTAQRSSGGSGGSGGGGQPEPEDHQSSGGAKFNAWYHDSTGHHDLQKGIKHVTGQTGGSGETLSHGSGNVGANRQTGGTIGGAGGTQRPLKGSARSAGGAQPAQQNPTGTGTTANWQGPATTHQASASGNGTSQFNATP